MSESWDDRKKALEEDYFRRKEQEAVEKQRQKREAERASAEAIINCPKCDGTLLEVTHENVQIDRCDKCNGVWLDAGEMERLTQREEDAGWLGRMIRSVSRK